MIVKNYIQRALNLGAPVIAGQLGFVLMGATDTVMCGKVNNDALASVGLGSGIYFLILILGMGILFGITSLVSIADGAKKRNESWKYLQTGLKLLIPITFFLCAVIFIIVLNFDYLDQPLTISSYTKLYLQELIWGTPFFLVFTLYSCYLNGLGKTIPAMVITVIALVLNYFFNDVLIFGKLGFPEFGFIGSAYATNLSKLLMCIMILIYAYTESDLINIRKNAPVFRFSAVAKETLTMGLPIGIQLFLEVFAFTASYIIVGWLGNIQLSAHQIVLNISSITFMFITGISTASNIMIGNGYGAKDKTHIINAAKACAFLILATELIFAAAFLLFPKLLVGIYTKDQELILFAAPLMALAAGFQVSDGFQNLGLNMLRGIKDVLIPALIALICYWVIMIPLSYYLASPSGFNLGVAGVWWGFVIGLSLASIIFILRFVNRLKTIENTW